MGSLGAHFLQRQRLAPNQKTPNFTPPNQTKPQPPLEATRKVQLKTKEVLTSATLAADLGNQLSIHQPRQRFGFVFTE